MEKSGPPALATEAYRITSLPPGWLGTGARFQNPPPATTATVTASTTACVSRPLSRDRRGVTSGVLGRASVKAGSGESGLRGRADSEDPAGTPAEPPNVVCPGEPSPSTMHRVASLVFPAIPHPSRFHPRCRVRSPAPASPPEPARPPECDRTSAGPG